MKQLRPISDSPWFWMLVYGGWTFLALALLSWKYGTRQSQLERQYQGRMYAAEKDSANSHPFGDKSDKMASDRTTETAAPDAPVKDGKSDASVDGVPDLPKVPTNFSSPENTIIALWPLTFIFLAITAVGGFMLWRERRPAGTVPSSI